MNTLSPTDRAGVERLVERCRVYDGVSPLNEAARLGLARPGEHLLESSGDAVVGYLHVGDDGTAQLAVDPGQRRRGVGTRLADRSPHARGWWAFGHLEPARAFARHRGLTPGRELLIMARSLATPVAVTPPPGGVHLRAFEPGRDEDAWLRVNAAAFAHHPEQGRLTRADLDARLAADWFDPAGLLLAERDGEVVGFHWTKVDQGVAEVYVLAVHPDAGGGGIGRALLTAGLAHLRERGARRVILYVEAGAEAVVALYRSSDFEVIHTDLLYMTQGER